MCNIQDGFKLCTCNNIAAEDAHWILERYNPKFPSLIVMGSYIPYDLSMADEAINQIILANLNARQCFDFDYIPKAKDSLAIAIDSAKARWFYFMYKNKKWVIDDSGPFEDWKQKLEAFKHGIIKND